MKFLYQDITILTRIKEQNIVAFHYCKIFKESLREEHATIFLGVRQHSIKRIPAKPDQPF